MPRQARIVVPDSFHHCVSRAIDRRPLFKSGYDKGRYLRRLSRLAAEFGVRLHGYCLMDNHIHLILTPTTADGLAKLFRALHTWYAIRFNRRHNRKGPVFESRFHSSPMDENHGLTAMRYVEVNPRRAGIANWMNWLCSSARANAEDRSDRLVHLDRTPLLRRFPTHEKWKDYLAETDSEETAAALKRHLRGNRPWGADTWLAKLPLPRPVKKSPAPASVPQVLQSTA